MSNTVLTIALIANLILNVVILVRLHEMDWKCFSLWPTMEWSVIRKGQTWNQNVIRIAETKKDLS